MESLKAKYWQINAFREEQTGMKKVSQFIEQQEKDNKKLGSIMKEKTDKEKFMLK